MAASIAQHGPFLAPTGTKLARHSTFQPRPLQNSPGTHKIGNIWPFWTCRANFLSHQTPLDAAHPYSQPRPLQNSPNNTPPAPQPVQNSPNNTPPPPRPVQNSPNNTPPAPQPVQNSPSTHKISKIQPFWTCRANFLSHQTPLDTTHPFSQPQPVQNSPSKAPNNGPTSYNHGKN